MPTDQASLVKLGIAAAALVLITVGCYLIGERSGRATVPENISAAPEVVQTDRSVVVERKPVSKAKVSPAPHKIPAGAIEERRIGVDVQPSAPGSERVHVDLSLVRQDGGRRVVASSPDGKIVGALDVPIEEGVIPAEPRRWAAGFSYGPQTRAQGIWIERDLARVRVGADLIRKRDGTVAGMIRLGATF